MASGADVAAKSNSYDYRHRRGRRLVFYQMYLCYYLYYYYFQLIIMSYAVGFGYSLWTWRRKPSISDGATEPRHIPTAGTRSGEERGGEKMQ